MAIVNQPGTAVNGSADILTGKHLITDLELRYAPAKGAQVALGASNLFDVYPDATPASLNTTGVVGFPIIHRSALTAAISTRGSD